MQFLAGLGSGMPVRQMAQHRAPAGIPAAPAGSDDGRPPAMQAGSGASNDAFFTIRNILPAPRSGAAGSGEKGALTTPDAHSVLAIQHFRL